MRIADPNNVRIDWLWSLGARTNRDKMCIYSSSTINLLSGETMWAYPIVKIMKEI